MSTAVVPDDLQRYLHEHIPLSRAMDVTVLQAAPERIVLQAPLAPNINHRETAFGGSLSALAILSAWSLLHVRLAAAGPVPRLVIQRNEMRYEAAVLGDFTAEALAPDEAAWASFTRMLDRKGKARIAVASTVRHGDAVAGRFDGEFVAIASP